MTIFVIRISVIIDVILGVSSNYDTVIYAAFVFKSEVIIINAGVNDGNLYGVIIVGNIEPVFIVVGADIFDTPGILARRDGR